jgi:hypothetical protein
MKRRSEEAGTKTRVCASLAASAAIIAAFALGGGAATGEIVEHGNVVVNFDGGISPSHLPRKNVAPVAVTVSGDISTSDGQKPPPVRQITLEINRHGKLNDKGLGVCSFEQIDGTNSADAMAACGNALVGTGSIAGQVALPDQAPLETTGQLLAFNGIYEGQKVIFLHAHVDVPLPGTFVIAFLVRKTPGTYGTQLIANFPTIASGFGYMTHFDLTLKRIFRAHGHTRSYISAACPAPKTFPSAIFPFARGTYAFTDGTTIVSTLDRTCTAQRHG